MTAPAATPTLEQHDDVFVLRLGDGENRFHPDWIAAIDDALDRVERTEGPGALVTAATGKFFSIGLDLDWLSSHGDDLRDYLASVHRLFARMLSLPVITVAAIQGHAFAAGAMLTLAHDFRVMREDRGFWCLPEVDLNLPFTPGMNALITSRLTPQAAHEAMTTARRYGGTDAREAGIVDRTAPEDQVVPSALDLAREHRTHAGDTLAAIKTRMYADTITVLNDTSARAR